MEKMRIQLKVNGKDYEILAAPNRTLAQVLREDLRLTGTKQGCEVGDCGSCTVLLDGAPVNSCLVLAPAAAGREVSTIEGVADGNQLHPIQEAMIAHGAIQCGFCTPGMIMSAKALLDNNPDPDEGQIRQALSGNLCRCTGYQKIVEAVQDAAAKMGRS
jgi:aerobic-type carbon monoxide dehydrogenase small subunit (CoxS/CutS family)